MTQAVVVEDLVVRYGDLVAVDRVSFSADAGEITAVLGPNGAGKTTTIEVCEGYRAAYAGTATVLGMDPLRNQRRLSSRMGVMLQDGGVSPSARVGDIVRLYCDLYGKAVRASELIERVGLADRVRSPYRRLSGGEQQRLSLAMALAGVPDVVFLDEPTSGVDVTGRQMVRAIVRQLAADGCAVVLATHELEEAEKLADRVVILDRGRVVADSPLDELRSGHDEIRFRSSAGLDVNALESAVGSTVRSLGDGEFVVDAGPDAVAAVAGAIAAQGLSLSDIRAGRQRLEEVFLRLTGHPNTAAQPDAAASRGCRHETGYQWHGGSVSPLRAQLRHEVSTTLRNGEQLLLTLIIPLLLLVFFSLVDVLPTGTPDPVDFLVPGILGLAVMSSAMVSLGIGTGFERSYKVLKRLGTTPLGRSRLISAKILAVVLVELVQIVVLVPVAYAVGWRPEAPNWSAAAAGVIVGTFAFAGIGLSLAGRLRAEVNLAAQNGLYLVLLLLGGMVIPFDELPAPLAAVAKTLPSAALADVLREALAHGGTRPGISWSILVAWAVTMPALAAAVFRWE